MRGKFLELRKEYFTIKEAQNVRTLSLHVAFYPRFLSHYHSFDFQLRRGWPT